MLKMDLESVNTVDIFVIDMDIKENMSYLKARARECLNIDLSNASTWVLSQKKLSDMDTLQDLCNSYKGVVQVQFVIYINEETQDKKIDVLDVFIPNEGISSSSAISIGKISQERNENPKAKNLKCSRWIASDSFKDIQRKFNIPKNPELWDYSHVEKWLLWVKETFSLENLNISSLKIDGRTLCSLKVEQFEKLIPEDPHNLLFMHLEILRKTHTVAVLYDSAPGLKLPLSMKKFDGQSNQLSSDKHFKLNASVQRLQASSASPSPSTIIDSSEATSSQEMQTFSSGSTCDLSPTQELPSSGFPQSIQLWQFLLKLLTDPESSELISWCGKNGEFKFLQPEVVAKLWGKQKGKANMTYEKLSRSLRYYYESEEKVINKVNRQNYVYKFKIDLKQVLGYDSSEIEQQLYFAKNIQN